MNWNMALEPIVIEAGIIAFTSFFALIDPIGNAALFASLTSRQSDARRRAQAIKGSLIALVLLLLFMFMGEFLLSHLGISLAALRTSGGILLLILGIDMVFAMHSGGTSTTDEEEVEARASEDISVFPLATPLIAGPGAISAVILLRANAEGAVLLELATVTALFAVIALTFLCLLAASQIQRLLGTTGLNVITRIMGVILSALAVQFMFDGLADSGLLS